MFRGYLLALRLRPRALTNVVAQHVEENHSGAL